MLRINKFVICKNKCRQSVEENGNIQKIIYKYITSLYHQIKELIGHKIKSVQIISPKCIKMVAFKILKLLFYNSNHIKLTEIYV